MNRTLRFQHLSHELTRPIASFVHSTNLYSQHHPTLDLPNAADIRLSNLTHYLNDHQHARIALIGEAAGYAGCRFTGIPFTCEAQLREWDDPRYRTPACAAITTSARPVVCGKSWANATTSSYGTSSLGIRIRPADR